MLQSRNFFLKTRLRERIINHPSGIKFICRAYISKLQAVFTEAEDAEVHTLGSDFVCSQPDLAIDQMRSLLQNV